VQAKTRIYSDRQSLNLAAAEHWVELYKKSVTQHGAFNIALAGGSTPRGLYKQLSLPHNSQQIEWSLVNIYFGDERSVPHEHPDSNFRMAKETFLDHVPIPESNIHRIDTECGDMTEAASRYERVLIENLPQSVDGVPQFDLILLGVGPDGHTASLFPDTDILQQQNLYVAAVYVKQKSTWRVSITFPVINNAHHVLFLVAGADKYPVMQQFLEDSHKAPLFPVQMLEFVGEVEIYLDSDAAGK